MLPQSRMKNVESRRRGGGGSDTEQCIFTKIPQFCIIELLFVKFVSSFEFLSPQNMEIDTLLNKIGQKIRFPTKIKYLYVCTLALSGKYAKFQSPITPKPKKIEKNFDTL